MRLLAMVVVLVAVFARAEPIEDGLTWLRAQQGPDGELGAALGEDPLVATTEAIATWKVLGLESQPETLAALSAIGSAPLRPETEVLLRRHLALSGTPWDFSVTTFAAHSAGFEFADPWLMAWSLLSGETDSPWIERAIALANRRDTAGCLTWADNEPSSEVTGMAVLALRRRSDVPALLAARASMVACLVQQQRVGGDFGGPSSTATALLALQSVSLDVSANVSAARAALLAMQAPNGSWGSVRATALALRALGGTSPDWEVRSEFGRALVTMSAPSVLSGQPAQARAQFRNASAVVAQPVLVRFTLKQGGVSAVTQDVWLPSLNPGALAEVSASLPTTGLAGQYVVEAEANAQRLVPELDVTNNRATGSLSVLQGFDLSVTTTSLQFLPDTASTARVRVSVQNRGATLPTSTTVAAWAFAPRVGRALGSFLVPAGTAQGQTVSGELVFSTTDLRGMTAIHAVVDSEGTLEEYDEGNNATFRYFENGAQNAVDLVATTTVNTTPSLPSVGVGFRLQGQVTNASSQLAQRVMLVLVEEATAIELARGELPSIAANTTAPFEFDVNLTENSKVILRVDPDETLIDSNRANNTALLAFPVLPKTANFKLQRATFSDLATGQSTSRLNVTLQSAQAAGAVEVRVRELVSGSEVGRATLNVSVGDQNLSFAGLDLTDTSKVYEACVDPDDRFPELIETDNCLEASASTETATLRMRTEDLHFTPVGASVGEKVTIRATARNQGTAQRSFVIEFFHGAPTLAQGRLLARSSRLTAAAGGSAEAQLEWIRTEGPIEIYARIAAVDAQVEDRLPLVAGRHLFLEEIFDLGLRRPAFAGVQSIRTGRVTGGLAPDVVVSYFIATGQSPEAGIALISAGPSGRQTQWRRALGTQVFDHSLIDVERDGAPEILVTHFGFDGFVWMTLLNADGSTRWAHALPAACGPGNTAVGDLDGDGIAEIAFMGGATLTAYSGSTGNQRFSTELGTFFFSCGPGSLYFADTNGDGQTELVGAQSERVFTVRHDGTIRWVTGTPGVNSDVFALVDLDADAEPELVFPTSKGATVAVSSATGAVKYGGAFTDTWPALAVGPLRQNGLPYAAVANNNTTIRVMALSPALSIAWNTTIPTASPTNGLSELTLADLDGTGRAQVIGSQQQGGPVMLDGRTGRILMPKPVDLQLSEARYTGPVVVSDLVGQGTSSKVVLGFVRGQGTSASLASQFEGGLLIFGSAHWSQRQPTAWPTMRLTKGAIGEDLKLGNDYRWWTTHNTHNHQFFDEPARSLADLEVALSVPTTPRANTSVPLAATVTNVGGLPATGVSVAFYDGRPDRGGALLGRAGVSGSLGARGGSGVAALTWIAWAEGDHELCAVVNDDRAVEEPDNEGNVSCRRVIVASPVSGCDLAVFQSSLILSPVSATPGAPLTLSAVVQNVGAAECGATTLTLEDGPSSNSSVVGVLPVAALAPGMVSASTFSFVAVAGVRQWRVTSDRPQTLHDVDRTNDVASIDGFYSDSPLPELLVEALSVTSPRPAYPGELVALLARVRNLGAPSAATALALATGERAPIPALGAGEAAEVSLAVRAGSVSTLAQATIDPEQLVAELDETNNDGFVSLEVAPSPLQVTAVASPAVAGPQTAVGLAVSMTPQDATARAITLSVSVVDGAGRLVASLLSAAPRVVAATSLVEQLSWNTGATPAGSYAFKVRVEGAGRLLGATETPIQIQSASPALTASLIANRGSVEAGKDVVLSFVARNESGNVPLGPLVGTLSVFSPSGALVFREVRQLGLLQPSGLRTGASVVSLARNASTGRYLATLEFSDATTSLAQAGTSFDVSASTDALSAALSAQASFQVGALLPVSVTLENRGASAISGETLTVELLNAEASLAAESLGATVVTLAAGASSSVTLTLATTGVPTGQKLLVARMGGRVLDTRPVTALPVTDLEPPRIEVAGIGDGDFRNVDIEPVVTVSDASAYSMVALLDGATFSAGDRVTAEGPHILVVEAQDVFGNSAMVTIRFVIDKTPPSLTLTGPADGSVNAAAQTLVWASADASPVVTTGTLDGATIPSGTVVAVEGDFVWTVRAEDAAGNATGETRRFAVDLTAPTILLDAPADGAFVRGPVSIDWTITDAHVTSVVALLNGVAVVAPSSVSSEGPHALTVTAADAAGNTATASSTFTIDDTAPTLVVSGVLQGAIVRGPVVPLVTATDASPLTVSLTLDGAAFTSGTPVLQEGEHVLSAIAVDAAGNTASRTVQFTIDDTAPAITVAGVVDGALLNTPVSISFSATDPHLASVLATLDGAPYASGQLVSVEGGRVLVVTALDAAGNQSSRTLQFTLDFTAPTIAVTGVSDGASGTSFTPIITVSSATTVSITLDGVPFTSGTTVTAQGAHVLLVVARDGAGNVASVTVRFTVVASSGACVDETLVAQREYSPSNWSDSAKVFSSPIRITIPWTIDVVSGNAGNKTAYVFFGLSGRTTRCEYEGGSPVAHPTQASDVLAGRTYHFRRCLGGQSAGATVTADALRLHVHNGDSRRGATVINWRLQELTPCVGAVVNDEALALHCGHESASCVEGNDGDDDEDEGQAGGSR